MNRIIIFFSVIYFTCSCRHNKQPVANNSDLAQCSFTKIKSINDTLSYKVSVVNNQYSVDVVTLLYDTTVIPREAMGIEENVIDQTIYFNLNGKIIKTYAVPTDKIYLYDEYIYSIKQKNHERLMALNHVYFVRTFQINNELYYIFEGGENLQEKREYVMIADWKGQIQYEKYRNEVNNLDEFMKLKGVYDIWKAGQLNLQSTFVYGYESCCKQEISVLPYE